MWTELYKTSCLLFADGKIKMFAHYLFDHMHLFSSTVVVTIPTLALSILNIKHFEDVAHFPCSYKCRKVVMSGKFVYCSAFTVKIVVGLLFVDNSGLV